jgi:ParB-like nuclease domain
VGKSGARKKDADASAPSKDRKSKVVKLHNEDQPQKPFGWITDKVEQWDIDDLKPYDRNARTHSEEQIEQVIASIKEFGWTIPVLVAESGIIIAGHARVIAAKRLGIDSVPVIVAKGWSQQQCRAYTIADNRLAENSGWDKQLLLLELGELKEQNYPTDLLGFSSEQIKAMWGEVTGDKDLEGATPGGLDDAERGSLLSLIDITIADPKTKVVLGDHFILDDRHHLLCVGVMNDWPQWTHLLIAGSIFCPYPGPFTPFGDIPNERPLVMVQPDPYICGHILDHYIAVHGQSSVTKEERDDD